MTVEAPQIDLRRQPEISARLRELLLRHCPGAWEDMEEIREDRWADALVQVYARMMETVIRHVNRVPDKNFIAFLDTLGISPLPPRPARTALVFELAKGSPPHAKIPVGTQVAAAESPDGKPVVFETEDDLTVIAPGLIRAISISPAEDKYSDHSGVLLDDESDGEATLLKGNSLIPHRLYIAGGDDFAFEESATITVKTEPLPNLTKLNSAEIDWYACSEEIDKPVKLVMEKSSVGDTIVFKNVAPIPEIPLSGFSDEKGTLFRQTGRFIYAELNKPIPDNDLPVIINLLKVKVETASGLTPGAGTISNSNDCNVTGQGSKFSEEIGIGDIIKVEVSTPATIENRMVVAVTNDSSLKVHETISLSQQSYHFFTPFMPELAFSGHFPLDVTKDFLPFGDRPKLSDVFYIGSAEVFGKVDALIDIFVALTPDTEPDTGTISLTWEFWDGKAWSLIANTDNAGVYETSPPAPHYFSDSTNAFIQSGTISFKCPPVKIGKVNGEENHWLRVRISGGDYGKEAESFEITKSDGVRVEWRDGGKKKDNETTGEWDPFPDVTKTPPESAETEWCYSKPTYNPPSIQLIRLTCAPNFKEPEGIVLGNGFFYETLFYGDSDAEAYPFSPFRAVGEDDPALYLAFDQDLSKLPLRLFFPLLTDVSASATNKDNLPPDLKWEYWDGEDWKLLLVEDETKELTRRGMVNLLIPEDFEKSSCFGEQLHWIRARLASGEHNGGPLLAGIYRNAAWAENRVTVKGALLGSGIGIPNQRLTLPGRPALAGQEIVVRELELAEEEKKALEGDEGEAVLEDAQLGGAASEKWVRWHEVDHFKFSGPHSRHYLVDREQGTITFGDGKKGMIPQAGRNNIMCRLYRYGGGLRGNVKKGQVTKLRKAIPYIDAVSNPVDAEGGVEVEDFEKVRVRGPRTIRHRNKAVTVRDYEWIVKEASPKVARVKGLSVMNPDKQFKPGWVTVMIVPESEEVKPLPSAELIGEVKNYLSKRSPSSLTKRVEEEQINIIPPNYLKVEATVTVVVRSISDAKEVENLVTRRLLDFFHPLMGGPAGEGWEFGRDVYKTEIYEALEKVEKVDYVGKVALKASEQIYRIIPHERYSSGTGFPDHSMVYFEDKNHGRIIFSLAEKIDEARELNRFSVTGFMEGDHVCLKHEMDGEVLAEIKLYVTGVDGEELACSPEKTEYDFPAFETVVETYLKPDGLKVRSSLTETINGNSEITELKVAVPLSGNSFEIVHRDWRSNRLSGLVADAIDEVETVYLEEDYLVYSGSHTVLVRPPGENYDDVEYAYLLNTNRNSKEVHRLKHILHECNVLQITEEHRRYISSLDEIAEKLIDETYDYCAWCFSRELSKRNN